VDGPVRVFGGKLPDAPPEGAEEMGYVGRPIDPVKL